VRKNFKVSGSNLFEVNILQTWEMLPLKSQTDQAVSGSRKRTIDSQIQISAIIDISFKWRTSSVKETDLKSHSASKSVTVSHSN
jgi:hypothetical protein